jgi:transposase
MPGLGYDGGLSPPEAAMSRKKKDPLRELTEQERQGLDQLGRSQSAPAVEVTRAKILLAVARGDDYQTAARSAGRRSGDAVSHLVARFNAEGLDALTPRHGGGRRLTYGPPERARIAAEAARTPTPEGDGTAIWSLSTLRRTLRAAPDGLPKVSTDTIRRVLHESGSSYQRTRSWCPTGKALRRRKAGPAVVTDPDSDAKKS